MDGTGDVLEVVISGVPDGASLSEGTDNGDGSWTLTPAQLEGLTVTPAAHDDDDFTLTITATSDDGEGGTSSTVKTMDVEVSGVADAATVTAADVTGAEDTAIALDMSAAFVDTDGSETMSITITGVPTGASLSSGTDNGGGSWTLTQEQLDGLTITPAANDSSDFTLSVSATTAEDGTTATSSTTFDVSVTGVADQGVATVQDETGDEDSWIQLNLSSGASVDTDGSEAISITITDVPDGATLNPGTDHGDGSWSVSAQELPDVCILPPQDFNGDISMTLNVTTTEADGDQTTVSDSFTVSVADVTDGPTPGDDNLTGTSGDDTIDGLAGNDMIYGGDGEDTLTGGTGSDFLSGGDDDDDLNYSADGTWGSSDAALNVDTDQIVNLDGYNQSEDVFDGGEGADVLSLTVGNDAIFLDDRYSVFPDGEGARIINVETINAGAGNDLVDLTSSIYGYGDVTINGEDGNDIIWSGAGDDTLSGGDGNDMLYGGAGDDDLSGGAGNDTLFGGTGSNDIDGGSGIDTVDYSASGVSVKVSLKDDYGEDREGSSFYDDLSNVENVTGSAFDDYIKGDSSDNTLTGGDGDDTLKGESGADILFGGDGADTVSGGSGADLLYGGAGDDTMKGGGGSDFIYGGDGADNIDGGGGDDFIVGGSGADTLKGGKGDDTFRFESLDDLGDTITDYNSKDDELSFDSDTFNVSFDANTGMLDASEFEEIDSSAGEVASGDSAFVFDTSTDELYYDQSGSGEGYTLVANIDGGELDSTEIKIE